MRTVWIQAKLTCLAVCGLGLAVTVAAQAAPKAQARVPASSQTCTLGSEGIFKCPRFGFTYKTTFGWVDRTDDMQADAAAAAKPESDEPGTTQSGGANKPETLLAVFERPPGAPGDTINSAVVIVAESLKDYHGIKTAADYLGPITELAEQRGFKVENEPQAFSIGAKELVRGDFSKHRGKLTMWQSSLVVIEKGYIVSFTFVGGSEDEVEGLIGNLSFGARLSKSPAPAE